MVPAKRLAWFQQRGWLDSSKEKGLVQQREKLGSSKNKKGLVSAKRKAWFKHRERLGSSKEAGLISA